MHTYVTVIRHLESASPWNLMEVWGVLILLRDQVAVQVVMQV